MIELCKVTEERGDCTAGYAVWLHGDYTVRSFIQDIITNRKVDWGYIGIYVPVKDRKGISDVFPGNPCCEYKWGKLKSTLPEEWMDRKVVAATADGGWSRMDYSLVIEGMEEEE